MFSLYDSYRGTEIQDKLFLPTLDQIYTLRVNVWNWGKTILFTLLKTIIVVIFGQVIAMPEN